jgi:aspartyl-tRNA synthetase
MSTYRSHDCGTLRISHVGEEVQLSGWISKNRDLGGMTFIDLRDRYGLTQLVVNPSEQEELAELSRTIGREFVVRVEGTVAERSNKNPKLPTGDIEIIVEKLVILNTSKTPPFTIEEDTDGGEELRMKYRYLDLRRPNILKNMVFRSQVALEVRKYLSEQQFTEVETPFLIKSTPEGARDFVVPSRMNPGQAYALPQSPQTFKQLLMVAGLDRYFQIVKCFRDEDLRADRQPEFTQIDCEMSFVSQEEILQTFEGLTHHLFNEILNVDLGDFPRMTYDEAMARYGSDKPDLRFEMEFIDFTPMAKGHDFAVFDQAEAVLGICVPAVADDYSNKDLKKLTDWVRRPQIGAKGLVYVKCLGDGQFKSPVGKFFSDEVLAEWQQRANATTGDLLLILSGDLDTTRKQLGALRLEMAERENLIPPGSFKPLWVTDFPLLEWDEDDQRFYAMHHPFTSPKKEDIPKLNATDQATLASMRADAYDLVINGAEIGGGSIRIHNKDLQMQNLRTLGFTVEEAQQQFGFLLNAFEYGTPPHGGIAFGFDRLVAIMAGQSSIRDFIAFPKNNQGRDVMIDAPSTLDETQWTDLHLRALGLEKAVSDSSK